MIKLIFLQHYLQKSISGICIGLWILVLSTIPAHALYVTDNLEILRIPAVGSTWQSISAQNSYTSPVVVCTYSLPSDSDNEAVVRIQNAGSSGFQVQIQRPENGSDVTGSDVYCLVADDGDYTLPSPDGRIIEAHTVLSDGTNGSARGWGVGGINGAEDVSANIDGSYPADSQPVVLGQVMTYNDTEFSAFWSFDCDNRANPPFQTDIADGICVGKHVGQISGTSGDRANETLGYIVIAEGTTTTGSFGGISYRVELGADSVQGVGNSPPDTYALGSHYDFAVATKEAEDGSQGGWAVLYGSGPLAGNDIDLAIDEETVEGDTSRRHTQEQVAYWAFRGTDHGDAPSSYGDASHTINGLLSIGSTAAGDADAEAAQYSIDADADDDTTGVDAGIDDEDGLTFRSPGGTDHSIFADVEVNNATGDSVTVCGWLDVPSGGSVDGSFDSSDGSCQSTSAANPTLIFQWSGLPTDQQYTTYVRFRITSETMGTGNATGSYIDGEVEDYQVIFDFRPTAVTIGKVELETTLVTDFLAGLNIEQMDREELLLLLTTWNPGSAATLERADREHLLDALYGYLDPDGDGQVAVLKWDTLEERGTIGFYVKRASGNDDWVLVNNDMLPGLINAPMGGEYLLVDPVPQSGRTYQYLLIEQEATGNTREYGPYTVEME